MKRVIAISFALLLLSSNMGFAIATHYCGGRAVESKLVFGHGALDCGMASMDQESCSSKPMQMPHFKKKPCCENKYKSLDVEDDFKPVMVHPGVSLDFVAAFAHTFFEWTFPSQRLAPHYPGYSPPPIEQDIPVLYQVFRI